MWANVNQVTALSRDNRQSNHRILLIIMWATDVGSLQQTDQPATSKACCEPLRSECSSDAIMGKFDSNFSLMSQNFVFSE